MDFMLIGGGFIAGAIAGAVITKLLGGNREEKSLRRQLDQLRTEHHKYQVTANEHFSRTADLIDAMNRNYHDIQAHLMQGAEVLVSLDHRLESSEATEAADLPDDGSEEASGPEAPRDWAPRNPDEDGMLSERFSAKAYGNTKASPEE